MRMFTNAHVNTKAIVVSVVAGAIVLYIAYTMYAGREAESVRQDGAGSAGGAHPRPPGDHLLQAGQDSGPRVGARVPSDSWKGRDYSAAVPNHVLGLADKVAVENVERSITLPKSSKKITVFYREAGKGSTKVPVLLLHGAKYTSMDWVKLKTLHLIAALGHHVIAVDLPGSGKSGKRITEKAGFLEAFTSAVNIDRPVIVSPSMSGTFSLPFILKGSPGTCTDRVRGFIPVAPSSTNSYTTDEYAQCKVPVMIVYGSKDTKLGKKSLENLKKFPNHRIQEIEDAHHAAYLEDPNKWHSLIHNYLVALESS